MKILFDTNVLVSALLSAGGQCSEIVDHAIHEHELYTTIFILDEFKKVFTKDDFRSLKGPADEFLRFARRFYVIGKAAASFEAICRDPNDDQVLADAVLNGIDVLITGDKDLLILKTHENVRILNPQDYWSL